MRSYIRSVEEFPGTSSVHPPAWSGSHPAIQYHAHLFRASKLLGGDLDSDGGSSLPVGEDSETNTISTSSATGGPQLRQRECHIPGTDIRHSGPKNAIAIALLSYLSVWCAWLFLNETGRG